MSRVWVGKSRRRGRRITRRWSGPRRRYTCLEVERRASRVRRRGRSTALRYPATSGPMGYFTYRIFKDVAMPRLVQQVKANLDLYEPGTVGREVEVTALKGDGCSAILMGYLKNEDAV